MYRDIDLILKYTPSRIIKPIIIFHYMCPLISKSRKYFLIKDPTWFDIHYNGKLLVH